MSAWRRSFQVPHEGWWLLTIIVSHVDCVTEIVQQQHEKKHCVSLLYDVKTNVKLQVTLYSHKVADAAVDF